MIAKDRVGRLRHSVVVLAAASAIGGVSALAQQQPKGRSTAGAPANAAADTGEVKAVIKAVPVNPTDAVAVVNGESITRAQLSDECVARKGAEILDTLIARKLIDQALRKEKMQVTAAEVEAEIEKVAQQMAGVSKTQWLLELEKNRNVSPYQYRRDIIYPSLALRKLALPNAHVSPDDIKIAREARYGDKLVCRMIMVATEPDAREIWGRVKKNPAGFQKEAELRSRDEATRAIGGMLGRPLSRHEQPSQLSDAAFRQLVDGEKNDMDPSHKPKDGDISGPVQVAEMSWVILKRESVLPAQKIDENDAAINKELHDLMFEVKVREQMASMLERLTEKSSIENRLTGLIHSPELNPPAANLGAVKSMTEDPKLNMRTTSLPAPGRDAAVGRAAAGTPVGVSEADKPFAKKPAPSGGSNP